MYSACSHICLLHAQALRPAKSMSPLNMSSLKAEPQVFFYCIVTLVTIQYATHLYADRCKIQNNKQVKCESYFKVPNLKKKKNSKQFLIEHLLHSSFEEDLASKMCDIVFMQGRQNLDEKTLPGTWGTHHFLGFSQREEDVKPCTTRA